MSGKSGWLSRLLGRVPPLCRAVQTEISPRRFKPPPEGDADRRQRRDRAVKIAPRHSLLWKNKGMALTANGRMQEAEECFRRARQLGGSAAGEAQEVHTAGITAELRWH